jgi:hypothetical protein
MQIQIRGGFRSFLSLPNEELPAVSEGNANFWSVAPTGSPVSFVAEPRT